MEWRPSQSASQPRPPPSVECRANNLNNFMWNTINHPVKSAIHNFSRLQLMILALKQFSLYMQWAQLIKLLFCINPIHHYPDSPSSPARDYHRLLIRIEMARWRHRNVKHRSFPQTQSRFIGSVASTTIKIHDSRHQMLLQIPRIRQVVIYKLARFVRGQISYLIQCKLIVQRSENILVYHENIQTFSQY